MMKLSDLSKVQALMQRRDRLKLFEGAPADNMNASIFGYDAGRDIVAAIAPALAQAVSDALARNSADLAALGVEAE